MVLLARDPDHARTGEPRHLALEVPDAAGSGGHEHEVVVAEPQGLHEPERRDPDEVERPADLPVHARRAADERLRVDQDVRRVRAVLRVVSEHLHARRDAAHVLADLADDAREAHPLPRREGQRDRVLEAPLAHVGVHVADARGDDLHEHLTGAGSRSRRLGHLHHVDAAVPGEGRDRGRLRTHDRTVGAPVSSAANSQQIGGSGGLRAPRSEHFSRKNARQQEPDADRFLLKRMLPAVVLRRRGAGSPCSPRRPASRSARAAARSPAPPRRQRSTRSGFAMIARPTATASACELLDQRRPPPRGWSTSRSRC